MSKNAIAKEERPYQVPQQLVWFREAFHWKCSSAIDCAGVERID